jgi:hypothetical protein
MTVTASWFGPGLKHALSDADWASDTIKVALTSSAYTPNQDTHEWYSDLTSELATANGYTAGGVTLTSKTVTYDAATNQIRLDAADTVWTATTGNQITARRAVIYKWTGVAGTSPLLGWVDFGLDVTATSDAFTITWDATGILRLTAA